MMPAFPVFPSHRVVAATYWYSREAVNSKRPVMQVFAIELLYLLHPTKVCNKVETVRRQAKTDLRVIMREYILSFPGRLLALIRAGNPDDGRLSA